MKLLILGAGGNSREVAEAAQDLGWDVIGFLDDNGTKHGTTLDGLPILGPLTDFAQYDDAACVCALATYRNPRLREQIIGRLNVQQDRWATIIHPRANIARSATIGRGCMILAGAFVGAGAVMGSHVMLLQGAVVSHDCRVGDRVSIASNACLAGGVCVGESAYVGMGALVRGGVCVGAGAVVGMGAVALHIVQPGSVVVGNPARVLR